MSPVDPDSVEVTLQDRRCLCSEMQLPARAEPWGRLREVDDSDNLVRNLEL